MWKCFKLEEFKYDPSVFNLAIPQLAVESAEKLQISLSFQSLVQKASLPAAGKELLHQIQIY